MDGVKSRIILSVLYQPFPSVMVHSPRHLKIVLLLPLMVTIMLVSSGCKRQGLTPVGPIEAVERDSVVALLSTVNQDGIRAAFPTLENYSYRRYLRTEQYDDEDFMVAFTEHNIIVNTGQDGRSSVITQADSGGTFDFGFFKRFVSENVEDTDPVDLIPFILDDDPIYLQPKNIDRYSFSAVDDTLMWDREALIIDVRAKADLADGLNVRLVRHYVDRATNQLVAMYLERIDLGMLFREESTYYVHIRPDAGGDLVPYNTRFETMIKTPFKTSWRIRTVSTYTDHVRTFR